MKKSFICGIVEGYVEKPVYLWIPIIATLLIVLVSYPLFLKWSLSEIVIYNLIWFSTIFMVAGKYMTLRWASMTEEEYDKALENPFKQKFIIPAKSWVTIKHAQQTDEPQRKDEIDVPANTKKYIMVIRTNSDLDLEIRDSQYSFGEIRTKDQKSSNTIIHTIQNTRLGMLKTCLIGMVSII